MGFFSTTVTATGSPQPATVNKKGISDVKQVDLVVRSLGNGTYIAIGGIDSQDRRLIAIGDDVAISANYPNLTIDLSKIFVSSDGTTGVLEVFGEV